MNRKAGSGQPRSATSEGNTDLIEELTCSREKALYTHLAPPKTDVRQLEE